MGPREIADHAELGRPPLHEGASASAIPLRLLLIEDSAFDAAMISRLVGQGGFNVSAHRVEDETGMRAALASEPWDVVISDHNLPGFSAKEALHIHQASGLDAPFIIVSGQIGEDVAVEAMREGADDYVLKSDLGRLLPSLQRSLRAAETRRIRRETEDALADSEERLRGIASNLPGMVFQMEHNVWESILRFRYASEGAASLLGVPAEKLLADGASFFDRIEPSHRDTLRSALARAAHDLTSVHWDGRLLPAEGVHTVWVALAGRPRKLNTSSVLWEGALIDVTEQKMTESALAQSREELRQLGTHMESVREEERKSIAREIHDEIGGILAGLKFELATLRARHKEPADLVARIDTMAALAESARAASDRIMHNLRPSILDQGIVAALEWLALQFRKNYDTDCSFSTNQQKIALTEARCTAMFRICQEALTNIAKHAKATHVEIELFADTRTVSLEISDNGAGILPADLERSERFGIRGMRERATGLGGWIEIHGSPNQGTTVMLSLPVSRGGQP